jgi:hypothetical protein
MMANELEISYRAFGCEIPGQSVTYFRRIGAAVIKFYFINVAGRKNISRKKSHSVLFYGTE